MNIKQMCAFVKSQAKLSVKATRDVYSLVKKGNVGFSSKVKTIYFRGKDIDIIKNDIIFASCGQGGVPAALITVVGNDYSIFVNSAWAEAETDVQEAIIAHELGHMACGHLDKMANMSFLDKFLLPIRRSMGDQASIDMEVEADACAISNGHREGIIKMLEIFQEYYEKYSCVMDEGYQRLWAAQGAVV